MPRRTDHRNTGSDHTPVLPDTARGARILRDIESLTRALSSSRKPADHAQSRDNDNRSPRLPSSLWNWKPLRAISHLRQRRFLCRFTVHVHSVRGLGPAFDDRCLWVRWKRAGDHGWDRGVSTRAVRVIGGSVRFDEVMAHRCFVYASRSGYRNSAKYEPRQFVLFASVVGEPEVDLGEHLFDITRILPLDLDELEADGCAGEWSTSFRLSGKAKGAALRVSFGFSVRNKGSEELGWGKVGILTASNARSGSVNDKVMIPVQSGDDAKLIREVSTHCKAESLDFDCGKAKINSFTANKNDDKLCGEADVEDLAAAFGGLSIGLDHTEVKLSYKTGKASRSLSLDDLTGSISGEFQRTVGLVHSSNDLSSEGDPQSPRERLWRQFEMEGSLDMGLIGSPKDFFSDHGSEDNSLDLSLLVEAAEAEHRKATQVMKSREKAKVLEDAEANALMREWGIDETAFVNSLPGSRNGFGSPIELPPHDPLVLPPLGEGLGPSFRTKNGGFLRTMSPSLFENSRSNGSLVMQVSNPVVVPAEMGSEITDILRKLASLGMDKLSSQARNLMPLEDITGKTMQQMAWERLDSVRVEEPTSNEGSNAEFVSLGELAPLAMDKIEALSIEGLRVQSGFSDARSWSEEGEVLGSEGAINGLMRLCISLDEWMRLDSGDVNEEDIKNSERTSRILAAHHANYVDLISAGSWSGRRCGLLRNDFTVALTVQLRDPTRNHEPVGTPMLALCQVERVIKIQTVPKSKEVEEHTSLFKITEVHVAGFRTDSVKKNLWGNPLKQSSGSRWLLANGMGKNSKHKPSTFTAMVKRGDTLWSISSRVHGRGDRWKELAALNPQAIQPQ